MLTFNYKDGAKTIVLDDVNGSYMVDNGPAHAPIGARKTVVIERLQRFFF